MTAYEEITEGLNKITEVNRNIGRNNLADELTKKVTKLLKTNFAIGNKRDMDKNTGYNMAIRDVLDILQKVIK